MNSVPTALEFGFMTGGDPRQAAELEARGVDSLWVGGHIASRNASPEAFVNLARLSAVTKRVRIGTSILLLPLYPPPLVAKQIADLDRLTDGRVVLGVGIGGEYPEEFRALQVPVTERGRRADEAIPLLRRLWTATAVTHHGRYYDFEDVKIHPAPLQPGGVPIVVAGRREPAMRRAATLGDGWMPYLYSPRRYATSVTTIRDIAAANGRDISGFSWYVFVFVNVNPDGRTAREQTAASIGSTYNQDFRPMLESVAAAGTPDEVARKLAAFWDAGARHFIFSPAATRSDRDAVVTRLIDEVIPQVHHFSSSPATFTNDTNG